MISSYSYSPHKAAHFRKKPVLYSTMRKRVGCENQSSGSESRSCLPSDMPVLNMLPTMLVACGLFFALPPSPPTFDPLFPLLASTGLDAVVVVAAAAVAAAAADDDDGCDEGDDVDHVGLRLSVSNR